MLSKFKARLVVIPMRLALVLCGGLAIATPAHAQISIGLDVGITNNAVCVGGGDSETLGVSNSDDCASGAGFTAAPFMSFDGNGIIFDADTGEATFNRLTTFNSQTVLNGVTSFTDTVSFSGSSVTFATPTTFTFPSIFQGATTFNGTTNFTAGMTTTNITNSGTINSNNVNVTGSLTAAPGTTINFGGVNRVQGVAAGINDLDAVNVGQLNAATSGLTTDVTALETLTATHTTQISAIEAVNATQATQITALEAAQDIVTGQIDTLFDLRDADREDMKEGIASAIAIAAAPMPSAPGKLSYAVNGASFRGQRAVGGSLMYRLPSRTPMAVNVGFSYAGNKNNGVRVGVAGEF